MPWETVSVSKKKVDFPEDERTIQSPAIHSFEKKMRDFLCAIVWKIGYEVASLKGDGGVFYFTDNALMRAAEALDPCQPES